MSYKLNRRGFMEAIVAAVGGAAGASVGSKISHNSQEEQIDWKARYEKGHQEWRESIAAKDMEIREQYEEICALEAKLYPIQPQELYPSTTERCCDARHRPFRGMDEIMLPWVRCHVVEAYHDDSS